MKNIESGIYKITNIVDNKIYVGSSINFKRRKQKHFYALKNNKHDNNYLQNAYNKHGNKNFKFEIIEYVDNKEYLLKREQFWIDKLNVCNRSIGYNICEVAGNTLGQKMSIETKKKISNSVKKYFEINSNPFYGKKHSDETKEILRRKRVVSIINITTGEIFDSILEGAKKYNTSSTAICNACNGKTKTSSGCKWKHLTEYNKENS